MLRSIIAPFPFRVSFPPTLISAGVGKPLASLAKPSEVLLSTVVKL